MKTILGVLAPLFFTCSLFSQTPELDKGRRLYFSNCISCHNKDPNVKGSMGPELVDSPLEVMTHKVMTGRYPDALPKGYAQKRKTRIMRAIPKLQKDIPAIYAWIQSVNKKKKPTKKY